MIFELLYGYKIKTRIKKTQKLFKLKTYILIDDIRNQFSLTHEILQLR